MTPGVFRKSAEVARRIYLMEWFFLKSGMYSPASE
jgi:hypothetical protein